MRATRTSRTAGRRATVRRGAKRSSKRVAKRVAPKPVAKPVVKVAVLVKKQPAVPLEPALYKLCKPGWAVIVFRARYVDLKRCGMPHGHVCAASRNRGERWHAH